MGFEIAYHVINSKISDIHTTMPTVKKIFQDEFFLHKVKKGIPPNHAILARVTSCSVKISRQSGDFVILNQHGERL